MRPGGRATCPLPLVRIRDRLVLSGKPASLKEAHTLLPGGTFHIKGTGLKYISQRDDNGFRTEDRKSHRCHVLNGPEGTVGKGKETVTTAP